MLWLTPYTREFGVLSLYRTTISCASMEIGLPFRDTTILQCKLFAIEIVHLSIHCVIFYRVIIFPPNETK